MLKNAVEAARGRAYARMADDVWQIGNDDIRLQIRKTTDDGLRWETIGSSLRECTLAQADSAFSLEINGADFGADLVVQGTRAWVEDDALRLEIALLASDGTTVFVQLECHDQQSVIRQWLEVEPSRAITLTRFAPISLTFASTDASTLHTVSGVQRQGGWRSDEGDYRSFRLESAALDTTVRHQSGPRSSWDETPWAAITGTERGGVFVALEYGGRWEMLAGSQRVGDDVPLSFTLEGIVPRIAAGERWVSPAAWIGVFPGDLDSAAAVMHWYIRRHVLPPTPADSPWVQYNTWFSWYCELDEETLLAEADRAAELGVEVFYVDAGWWIGNPNHRDRYSSGLGNWIENRDKFPGGLRAFADAIRERGMHFGIWVEPERVDLRTSTTGTWNPDWIARHANGHYVRCDWPSDTETAWLCFGHPEVHAWAEQWIGELVEELGVRWLKWDSNYWDVCASGDHGHGDGDGERAQVEGVYTVMDALIKRFPDLIIENCAGGATRLDFAISRHSHMAWLNDASQPAHRSRFHNAGASYLFPPEMLNAWITESEHENVNRQELTDPVWRSVIRSRMLGALGFSCQLINWSAPVRDVAREEVTWYKEHIRPVLRSGKLFHLLPQPSIPSRDLPTPDVWEAYQLSSADDETHVVLAFRNVSPEGSITMPLRLAADSDYIVQIEGEEPARLSGHDLVENGLTFGCPLLASLWITLRRESGNTP